MPLNVLIVPDKFKGTLTAQAAAELIAEGWHEARPQDKLELLPMSDGGDGFGEVLSRLLDVQGQTIASLDAAHSPREAKWWGDPKASTAKRPARSARGGRCPESAAWRDRRHPCLRATEGTPARRF